MMQMLAAHTARQIVVALIVVVGLGFASQAAEAASGTTKLTITLTPAAAELLAAARGHSSERESRAARQLLEGSATVARALQSSYSADQTRQILNQLESNALLLLSDGVYRVDSDGVTQQMPEQDDLVVTAYAL